MAKSTLNNMEVNKTGGFVLVSINPKIYNLDIIYSAAYALMDKAWVIIDGHPDEEVFVELKPKEKMNLEELGRIFNQELLNYAFYKTQAQQNQAIREILMKRAFLTNSQRETQDLQTEESQLQDTQPEVCEPEADLSYQDDPLGIAKPWTPDKTPKEESKK